MLTEGIVILNCHKIVQPWSLYVNYTNPRLSNNKARLLSWLVNSLVWKNNKKLLNLPFVSNFHLHLLFWCAVSVPNDGYHTSQLHPTITSTKEANAQSCFTTEHDKYLKFIQVFFLHILLENITLIRNPFRKENMLLLRNTTFSTHKQRTVSVGGKAKVEKKLPKTFWIFLF